MKKSHALRRRVLALIAALFLVTILSVPAFADSVPGYVIINGNLVLESDMDLSEYFELDEVYTVHRGTVNVLDSTGVVLNDAVDFSITLNGSGTLYVLFLNVSGSSSFGVAISDSLNYEDLYQPLSDRYLTFNNVVVSTSSPIYQLCQNCAAVTSTLTYQNYGDTSTNVVDVIVGGFNGVLTGFGSGTADFFETIFLNNDGSLTTFALVGLVFLGVGLSVGIARWVIKKVGH